MARISDERCPPRRLPRAPSEQIIAIFGACSLFLATIEFLFPKPLPYMRLGLANIPLLIALRLFRFATCIY